MAAPYHVPSSEEQARLARMVERDYRFTWRLLRRLGTTGVLDPNGERIPLMRPESMVGSRPHANSHGSGGIASKIAAARKP